MLKTFNYHQPTDLNEACRLLVELPDAQVLAGGTDLLVDIEADIRQADNVISLKKISGLDQIVEEDGKVSIGCACTARNIEISPLIRRYFLEIKDMIPTFASPQIRSRATIAGNICSAVACADFPVILIALAADVELLSQNGSRIIPLEDFFISNRETIRKDGEILTRILVPKKSSTSAACYLKFRRRASNSLAVAGVAAFLDISQGICQEARIVLGAVAPKPMLAEIASAFLIGRKVNDKAISVAAELAQKESQPITDVRGSREFRRELVFILTKRALKNVVEKIGNAL